MVSQQQIAERSAMSVFDIASEKKQTTNEETPKQNKSP